MALSQADGKTRSDHNTWVYGFLQLGRVVQLDLYGGADLTI